MMNSIDRLLEESLISLRDYVLTGKADDKIKGIEKAYDEIKNFHDGHGRIILENVFSKEAEDFFKKADLGMNDENQEEIVSKRMGLIQRITTLYEVYSRREKIRNRYINRPQERHEQSKRISYL